MNFSQANQRRLVLLGLVCLTLFWGLPFVISPLSSDEAFYALGGRVVFDGHHLYRDFWEIKPPLIYLIHVPIAPLAHHLVALRLFHLAASCVSVLAVFWLTRRHFGDRAAIIGAALYSFSFFAIADYLALGEAESFMIAPMAAAFALYRPDDADRTPYWRPAVSGALLGLVVAFKLSAVLVVLGLPAAEYFLREPGWRLDAAVRRLVLAAAGFVAVQAAWAGYLVADGSWSAFIDIQRGYTIPYSRYRWPEDDYVRNMLQMSADWFRNAAFITVAAWGALLLGVVGQGRRQAVWLVAVVTGLNLLSIWWQGKMFQYHWLVLLPFLAAMAGHSCDTLLTLVQPLGSRKTCVTAGVLACTFIVLALGPLLHMYDAYRLLGDRVRDNVTALQVENRYSPEFGLTRQLIDYIQANSEDDETFLIYGVWIVPYLEIDREFPTRFIANHAVRSEWTPERWQRELISDLRAAPPRFIVSAAGDNQPWLTGTLESSDQHFCFGFPELRQFVDANYRAVLNNGLFVVYDREASQNAAEPRCPP